MDINKVGLPVVQSGQWPQHKPLTSSLYMANLTLDVNNLLASNHHLPKPTHLFS